MPTWTDLLSAQYEIAHVENALIDGYPAAIVRGDTTASSARREASRRMGVDRQALGERIGDVDKTGRIYRKYGLLVDWSLSRKETPRDIPSEESPSPSDPIDLRRLRDDNARLKKRITDLERDLVLAQDTRSAIGLSQTLPPQPTSFAKPSQGVASAETVVLFLSDIQWGEKVDLDAMDGLNCYDVRIAGLRLCRWASGAVDLLTNHWSGPPPDRVILILGGDLISGGIHLELAKTDELAPLPAVRDVSSNLRDAILLLKESVPCPIDIISIAGNHGRTTLRPESKLSASTSLDVLVSDFLELALKDKEGISFFVPASPDALFSVYGWRILATHGDRIGSRGGQGFVGPAATIARGMKKLVADYAARGVHVDLTLMGHMHTRLLLEEGFSNGCLPGPTEYSRDLRFRPAPAQQLFLAIHPKRLWTQFRMIDVGHPSEGSLYVPPPLGRPLRPRYRVKTISRRV